MRKKITGPQFPSSREIQGYFNQPPPSPIQRFAWGGDALTEGLDDLRARWKKEAFATHVDMVKHLAGVQCFDKSLFDHVVTCLQTPMMTDFDILAMSMMPHCKLGGLWKFLYAGTPGISDSDFLGEFYEVKLLRRIFPVDVVALWLQVKASNKWRRMGNKIYVPCESDYEAYPIADRVMSFVVNNVTVTLPQRETIDRWYLGSGGLACNWKRLAYKQGFSLYCTGSALEGQQAAPLLSPPFSLDSEAYLSQLIHGRILPYHYPKIIRDWSHEHTIRYQVGSGSRSD